MFDYSIASWGPAQAVDYAELIAAACAELAEAPLRAPACDHVRPGYRRRGVGSHVIYFRPTDYGIAVIRILHQRMRAGDYRASAASRFIGMSACRHAGMSACLGVDTLTDLIRY